MLETEHKTFYRFHMLAPIKRNTNILRVRTRSRCYKLARVTSGHEPLEVSSGNRAQGSGRVGSTLNAQTSLQHHCIFIFQKMIYTTRFFSTVCVFTFFPNPHVLNAFQAHGKLSPFLLFLIWRCEKKKNSIKRGK